MATTGTIKGPDVRRYDGSPLRIGILHARWNNRIISSLLAGVHASLSAAGVKPENIVTQSVPGSYELPYAAQRMYAASQIESATAGAGGKGGLVSAATDLLGSAGDLTALAKDSVTGGSGSGEGTASSTSKSTAPFDAVIAIGVLIKGETMHFEYIADAVSHALMRVQLDGQVPVVFGLLTVLNEEQGLMRAGIGGPEGSAGHNHGEDWGAAAVELGVKRRGWGEGRFDD
ncbi:DMRL synthase family protein [Saccharata proteae CBS 121410]|uniref:6,7-dimethyl-8-ribityllumazine synthase n=1 Tax=Saccharata proteae CBS 121410 TaxID=1314787 RepID=A0A9P4HRT2_9PEZI|nr:DMRL synthase family protein [Saccharata proteae CBS 121410]